jgi:hypothetical protein
MKNCFTKKIIVVVFLLCSSLAFSQSQRVARSLVIQGKIDDAITGYARLAPEASGKTEILLEYAYALALGGMTENALMYVDRANLLGGGTDFSFYASQVLSLAGLDSLAAEFWTGAEKVPAWIEPFYQKFNEQYERQSEFEFIDADSTFSRADQLAARGLFFQALVLYEDVKFFVEGYENEFLPYISSSVVWEKLGKYGKAARELSMSMELMRQTAGEQGEQSSTIMSALPAFENHLQALRQKAAAASDPSAFKKLVNEFRPQTMLYAGGMYANSYVSLNSSFGVFLAPAFSAAFDLGLSGGGGSVSVNTGLNGYYRYKFLVGGSGLNLNIAQSTTLNWRFTGGFSFLNKAGNRSTDIFVSFDVPFSSNASTMTGISIGRSFYFGKRE